MRRSSSLFGQVGLILVLFGGFALWFTGDPSLYVLVHLGLGSVLLLAFLATRFRDLGALLGARSTRHGANMVVTSLLFVALLVGLNVLGVRHNRRWDLSESGAFSLSPQARNILDAVSGEVEMQAFLEGGQNPAIESVLDSFAAASRNVRVRLVDPDKEPELAERHGVRAYNTVRIVHRVGDCTDGGAADEDKAKTCAATVVAQPSEETISNALIKVTRAKRQVFCWVEGGGEPNLDDVEDPGGYGVAKMALAAEHYEPKKVFLAQDGRVPDDCDVLALVGPTKPLAPEEVKAIADDLGRGGRVLVMLSPRTGEALEPVLAEYGVRLGRDVVIDQVIDLFRGPQKLMDQHVNAYGDHPITRDLRDRSIFRFTRSVTPETGKPGLTAVSIASSSPTSWGETNLQRLFDQSLADLDPDADAKGPVSIAVASTAKLAELGRGEGEARLVVYGTAKLADNRAIHQFLNRDLFLNSVAWLASQDELVSVRPRSVRASRVAFDAGQATRIFYLSVLVLPELLLVAGLAAWWRRSRL